jgi:hypothetical protein
VAGFAANSFCLGSLPLSPHAFNISNLNDPIPSLLGRPNNDSLIPCLSWAYMAVAQYKWVAGSLTFGGYDQARFDNGTILSDITFGNDISRDLVVKLNSITYDTSGSSPLLIDSIDIFVDSMVSEIWLPTDVYTKFATAFNPPWNSTLEYYIIDDDDHTTLVNQNPTFIFTLGSTGNSDTVDTRFVMQPLIST